MAQSDEFYNGEGDAWFLRNQAQLSQINLSSQMHPLLHPLIPFAEMIHSILEIGCSDGRRLEYLCESLSAQGWGIDPSMAAIESGNQRLRNRVDAQISLDLGDASALPYPSGKFELIFVGFCYYLIDRDRLISAINEADRVLKPGGFVVIFDFDVMKPLQTPYHHREGIFTFKDDYSRYFRDLGNYHLAYKNSFGHTSMDFQIDETERIAYSVLFKEFTAK
jgi:ubiquinone/menaquinone biosynthesis C-methylase UbiE